MSDLGSVSEVPGNRGSVGGLISLYDSQVGEVYAFVMRRCGADRGLAEDITQEVFVAAARHFQLTAEVVGPGWLYAVSRRRLVDHWRSEERKERRIRLLRGGGDGSDSADLAEGVVSGDQVARALGDLPSAQQAAFALRYLDGYSTAEIAEQTGRSLKATESLLARARQGLAAMYQEQGRD